MIMSILATMAWQGVDGIVRARDASERQLQQTLRLNTVVAQWEQDLSQLQETDVVPALAFDGVSLRLTRRTEAGLQLVVWSLRPRSSLGAIASTGTTADLPARRQRVAALGRPGGRPTGISCRKAG